MRVTRRAAGGFAMIEVLASLLIASVGLIALVALQARAAAFELEASQRSQALVLLQDMAERLSANRPRAADYVAVDLGTGAPFECAALPTLAQRDLCEWSERLRGAGVRRDGRDAGAMIGARGCVAQDGAARWVITVAWQGDVPSAPPATACGRGAYGDESLRRAVSTVVRVADLTAP
ncbi:MAG TPA: type IV pilus modification protein PilV [Burkholderiaceae bacterium]|nr:type IV pilus modification protein PilV [Burkholderiaceae bacterium]